MVRQAEGLLDAPGDWLVRLELVVTAGRLNWLGYIEKFDGAVMAVWALSEDIMSISRGGRQFLRSEVFVLAQPVVSCSSNHLCAIHCLDLG